MSVEQLADALVDIRFSHPSAKDFLLSKQIQAAPARAYSIQIKAANTLILNTCLAYVLTFVESNLTSQETLKIFPLARYAALFWIECITPNPAPTTVILLAKQFQDSNGIAYRNWLHLLNHHSNSYSNHIHSRVVIALSGSSNKGYTCYAPPLVWASRLGLTSMVRQLLSDLSVSVNEPGGAKDSALAISTHQQHHGIMELLFSHESDLIDGGVNVKARSRVSGHRYDDRTSCALDAACQHGGSSSDTVRLLLDAGADPNLHIGKYGFPLHTAAYCRGSDIVQMLLDTGAAPKARSDPYGTALIAASFHGATEVVAILLAAGADTTVQWNLHGNLHKLNAQITQFDDERHVQKRWHERLQQPYDEDIVRPREHHSHHSCSAAPGRRHLWRRVGAVAPGEVPRSKDPRARDAGPPIFSDLHLSLTSSALEVEVRKV
ncbi:hypothetical protein MMC15_003516 [Xylographa vitiligo]|nr:hypothetical protein [Xylographa vitiligo]